MTGLHSRRALLDLMQTDAPALAQGREVALTSGEFDLPCDFARHPGRVLSRDFLLEQLVPSVTAG